MRQPIVNFELVAMVQKATHKKDNATKFRSSGPG